MTASGRFTKLCKCNLTVASVPQSDEPSCRVASDSEPRQ